MEIEAVHTSSWCQEDAGLLVKMSAHVHQDLQEQGRSNRDKSSTCIIPMKIKRNGRKTNPLSICIISFSSTQSHFRPNY